MRLAVLICAASVLAAQTPKDWYARGRQHGDLSAQAFEQLLKIAPESGYVLALLGEVKTKERQYTAALYAFNEASKRMPRLRGAHTGAAAVYSTLGKRDEAAAAEAAEQKLGSPN